MTERTLIDNDVALKAACYTLVEETVEVLTIDDVAPAMLGVGRFVIAKRIERAKYIMDRNRASAAFSRLLARVLMIEPDDTELSIAADLEAEANRRGLELDGGESQLLAVLANRSCSFLVTGDKRAIVAMSRVAAKEADSRIMCFEQLVACIVSAAGHDNVRVRVCGEPLADRAVTSCFGCSLSEAPDPQYVLDGLASYSRHLNGEAPGVLSREGSFRGLVREKPQTP
ncbi:hypothetical protein [Consotaella salsifontis]|uniref:Uncharacterized protein n=1 Tax=Consotaella salsifontis TaxID=1365950 RepID=A0A1T4SU94_9HYPH|nr:hypothetical protein [Consotaella salsifontis]SKA31726.1 hypothetical protein SAMN05428963_11449 [Consotaella salsifontis]